jgi:quercetin dioxygenase-like cupin family protein
MSVKDSYSLDSTDVQAGMGVSKQVLISADEGPNFAMRRFTINPGGGMPNHTNLVEHEQYVLRGSAEVGIGDEVFLVKKDDVVFIPAEAPHWYKNTGDEPFEFLCIVPNQEDETTILG